MSKNRTPREKEVIAKGLKQNKRMPLFVVAKTNRKVTSNNNRRNWRSGKLKMRTQTGTHSRKARRNTRAGKVLIRKSNKGK